MSHHHHHDHDINAKTTKDQLKILLKHWKEHNDSHIVEYEKWFKKAKEDGLNEYAELIEKVIEKMKEINEFYEKMKKLN